MGASPGGMHTYPPPTPRAQLHGNTHMEPPLGRAPVWAGWWGVALHTPARGQLCPQGSEANVVCLCSRELVLRKGVQATSVRDQTRSPVSWEALSCAEAGRSHELMSPSQRTGVRPGVPHRLRRRSPRQEAWWPRPEWDSSRWDTLWRQSPWGHKDRTKAVFWASGLSSDCMDSPQQVRSGKQRREGSPAARPTPQSPHPGLLVPTG